MKTDKQSAPILEDTITADLLLRSWNKTLDLVSEARKINNASGVSKPEQFIQLSEDPVRIKKYRQWLAECTNPKTPERFLSLESLIASGEVSESERKLFPRQDFPYRQLVSIQRRQTPDKREWIVRSEYWFGLSKIAAVIPLSVQDLDYHLQVFPQFEYALADPNDSNGKKVRIAKVGSIESGVKVFTTPFTAALAEEMITKYGRQPLEDKLNGTSTIFVKEGAPNPIAVRDLDLFIHGNFDEVYNQITTPAPVIKVDSRALLSHVQSEGTKAYQ
jgi:hypothetical protein